eukprot:12786136-Alexandrium_andersonii.AAC.1
MTPATPVSGAHEPRCRSSEPDPRLPIGDPELPAGTAKLPSADSFPPDLRARSSRALTCTTAPAAHSATTSPPASTSPSTSIALQSIRPRS